jgi:hypothetical protein
MTILQITYHCKVLKMKLEASAILAAISPSKLPQVNKSLYISIYLIIFIYDLKF